MQGSFNAYLVSTYDLSCSSTFVSGGGGRNPTTLAYPCLAVIAYCVFTLMSRWTIGGDKECIWFTALQTPANNLSTSADEKSCVPLLLMILTSVPVVFGVILLTNNSHRRHVQCTLYSVHSVHCPMYIECTRNSNVYNVHRMY